MLICLCVYMFICLYVYSYMFIWGGDDWQPRCLRSKQKVCKLPDCFHFYSISPAHPSNISRNTNIKGLQIFMLQRLLSFLFNLSSCPPIIKYKYKYKYEKFANIHIEKISSFFQRGLLMNKNNIDSSQLIWGVALFLKKENLIDISHGLIVRNIVKIYKK